MREIGADDKKSDRVYIVYMGAVTSSDGSYKYDNAQILSSVLKRFFLLIPTRTDTRMNYKSCTSNFNVRGTG